MGNST